MKSLSPEIFKHADKHKIIIKYIFSGLTAAAADFLVLYNLTEFFGVYYLISAGIAFICAFMVSFVLQKFWTFRNNDINNIYEQLSLYFFVAFSSLLLNTIIVFTLVEKFGIWYIFSQAMAGVCLSIFSFLFYKYVIFIKEIKRKKRDRKNILIATGIFPPDIGGPASYSETLLKELPKDKFAVTVLTYSDQPKNEPGVFRVDRGKNIFFRYFNYFIKAYRLVKKNDLIYVQGPVSEGLPIYLACKIIGRKYILKIVGDYAWEQGRQRFGIFGSLDDFQNKRHSFKVEIFKFIQKKTAKNAELIIVPSRYLKEIVIKWGVSGEKIKVIYNSTDKINIDDNFKTGFEGDLIFSVGRLVPWKGFEVLIEIMPDLIKFNPNFKLLIIGDGPDKGKLKEKIENLNLEKNVFLLGKFDQVKLWNYLSQGKMFLLNTSYEGLSHLIIEAMKLGLPVITTKVGGNPELIKNNETGILVEYNNKQELIGAVKSLWENKDFYSKISSQAKKEVEEKFSRQKMLERLINIFDTL